LDDEPLSKKQDLPKEYNAAVKKRPPAKKNKGRPATNLVRMGPVPYKAPKKANDGPSRIDDFNECAVKNRERREVLNLQNVSYDNKLTHAEIKKVATLLPTKISPEDVLSYTTSFLLSKVLCRWPRPSELARILYVLGHEDAPYYHLRQSISIQKDVKKGWGTVVGEKGKNLNEVTEESNILYAWLHKSGSKKAVLHLYGGTRESVIDALDKFKNHAVVSEIINDVDSKVNIRKRYVRKDFNDDFTFDHEAKPFRPKKLNPDAKPFQPGSVPELARRASGGRPTKKRVAVAK
jgi:hypothetical protein